MPTALLLEFHGLGKSEYDRVMDNLNLDAQPPAGGIFHVAGPIPKGWRIIDIWESQAHFEAFQRDRLNGALQKAGITTPPAVVEFYPVHNIYAPGIATVSQMGASSKSR